ncbi:SusC/RagA family TonB-linked outer membrane protein [Sphingobacterium hungaricum]|uniref:SusC/RagA family protein n=1 Tax=Sphingobacterium hungaricum TaxID=2082723 RepID=A0A928UTS6_9SPHI|nr:SusC/RagA family TonB-linked outer membrane protein [Sphingobacterium hungaricum]MBE8713080.1 SusC/RagA family protein [Sphingobacterium hungaricum]
MKKFILISIALGSLIKNDVYGYDILINNHLNSPKIHSENYFSQSAITGKVVGRDGPLANVTISVVGQSVSTSSNENGEFSIVAPLGSTLRFSSVGYAAKDVVISANTVNVTLDLEDNSLEEVVVVGYGTQKKGNLTGAVSSINVKENLEGRPIADIGRAIQGTTPGLNVVVPSGEVGSDPRIRIRGAISSMQGTNNPLILLDNVEIPSIQYVNPDDVESITVLKDAASASIYGAKAAFGVILITSKTGSKSEKININYSNNFSFQNPFKRYEMGRIDALKYTMDALERVGTLEAGAFYTINRESYEKAVEWDKKYGSSLGPDDPTVYGRDWYVDPASPTKKYGLRTYDPYDYMIREWAPSSTHNLSLNGTINKTNYTLSFGSLNQSGMLKPGDLDRFKRYNGALRVSTEVNKYLTVRAGAMFAQRNKTYPYATNSTTADPWLYMYRWSSLYPMGNDELGRPIRSPWSENMAANDASMRRNYINLNAGTTIKIMDNWRVDVDYNFTNENYSWRKNGTRYTAANSWTAAKTRLDASGNQIYVNNEGTVVSATDPGAIPAYDLSYDMYTPNGSAQDHIYMRSQNEPRHTVNAFTTYNLNINTDHEFKFIAGLNSVAMQGDYHWTQKADLMDITNPQYDLAVGLVTGSGGEYWESQLGFFGRVNYAFKNKYLFEGNLRYDGSSKFPTSMKWRWFPSVSAGWVASEESFMEWSKPVLSNLKFRGSWGVIGNQTVPSDLYVSNMNAGLTNWIINGAQTSSVGSPKLFVNDVTWEDIETLDFGVDARFLSNKIGVTFDWYEKKTNNMFAPLEGTTWTLGSEAPFGNYGTLTTRGFEIAIDFNHRFENGLGINLGANLDDATSVFSDYTSLRTLGANYNGRVYGDIWGFETDRLFQYSDFILDANGKPQLVPLTADMTKYNTSGGGQAYLMSGDNPVYQSRYQNSANFFFGPGDVKFKDLNGDGEIDNGDGTIDNPGDMKIIGNSTPRYNYGFRLAADWKGFDISAFFQGVGQRSVWGTGFLAIPGWHVSDGAMPQSFVSDYWTPENQDAFYPAAMSNAGNANYNNMQVQSRYLLDMSYLRVKNMTVGYSFSKELLSKVKIDNLRAYVALENFFTWDKLRGLPIDPEGVDGESIFNPTSETGSPLSFQANSYNGGRTGVGVPSFKSASFGIQLNF